MIYDSELELSGLANVISIGSGQEAHTVTVVVDGSENINHFWLSCSDDWITVSRTRNSITLLFNENMALTERFGRVKFTHNMDSDLSVILTFVQEVPLYEVNAKEMDNDIDEIEFDTLLGVNDPEFQKKKIEIECKGGLCDYRIRNIVEYAKRDSSQGYRIVPYDRGLKVTKIGTDVLSVTNFGKISPYRDMYYEIILAHRNNFNAVKRIKVTYRPEPGSGFELDERI